MKINNPVDMPLKPSVKPTSRVASAKEDVTAAVPSSTTKPQSNSVDAQQRIQRWFARVGIQSAAKGGVMEETERRVRRHRLARQQRKLANLDAVMEHALAFSVENGQEEEIDPDWFFAFSDMAEDIHAKPMQELWGKIFALEIGRPASFSLRTLQILKQLTQKDASIFRKAINLASKRKGDTSLKLIFGYYRKPSLFAFMSIPANHQLNLADYGLAYPDILSLMDLGLLYKTEIESGEQPKGVRNVWRCGVHTVHLAARKTGLILNYYKFTSSGNELARLLQAQPPDAYIERLRELFSPAFEVT